LSKVRTPKVPAVPPGTLAELLVELGIRAWDYVLVGDGSGQGWPRPAGWASVMVGRHGDRRVFAGAVTAGTSNMAEIMAYLQPLTFLANREADRRDKGGPAATVRVHVVTDSEYVQKTGSSLPSLPAKNAGLWLAFDAFRRRGFVLTWHWRRRATCALNVYADRCAGAARLGVEQWDPEPNHVRNGWPTAADHNP
jgi:ribonuclease HI